MSDELTPGPAGPARRVRGPDGAQDGQSPHHEEQVDEVTAGAAEVEVAAVRSPVGPGTMAYVPRGARHWFADNLEVTVLFAPPHPTNRSDGRRLR